MANQLPSFELEEKYKKYGLVVGVDEVGRGPWAGPVMAGAVWINPILLSSLPRGIRDSKKLTAKKRGLIYKDLSSLNIVMAIGQANVEEIDSLNILNASFLAMERAVISLQKKLSSNITTILVDGNTPPKKFQKFTENINFIPVVGGDNISLSIATASIIAKQTRDLYMCQLHLSYPQYGFNKNKGYGTKAHRIALTECGITCHHRVSFAPIKALKF